jgi:GldM C-terminal domain
MRFIFILLLFGFSGISTAQIQVYNRSLTDSTLPYLYIGVDNAIEVDWNGLEPTEHAFSISNGGGSIMKLGGNKFIVRVTTVTDDCVIRISNKKRKTVFEKVFKVRVIYLPEATLNGHQFDTVSKQEVLLFPVLNVIIPKSFWRHNYRIIAFEASFISNGDSIKISTQGNSFSKEQIAKARELNTGDEIYFDQIRSLSPDSRTIKLPSFWIKIK